MKLTTKAVAALAVLFISTLMVACGGGGGSSSSNSTSTNTTSQTSTYLSSVAVGDFGRLDFDSVSGAFKFTYVYSGYGLAGNVIEGNCILDTNGAYLCTATDGQKYPLFLKDNYAIFSVRMDPNGSPNDWTPVFGIRENQSISSASQILQHGSVLKVSGYSCNTDADKNPTACWATSAIGILEAGSDDSTLKVTLCNNGGQQEDNFNLSKCYENRTNPSAIIKGDQPYGHPGTIYQVTATYDQGSKTWNTTPNDKSKTSRGVFSVDSSSNTLVGFFDDVAEVVGASNGFAFITSDFAPVGASSSDTYLNIIPKQSTASGGSAGHGFQQHLLRSNGTTFNQCDTGVPQIASNMNDYYNQLDVIGNYQIPGYLLSHGKEPTLTSDYYVLSTFVKNSDGTAIGVAAANNARTSSDSAPIDNFKLLYFAKKPGYCY